MNKIQTLFRVHRSKKNKEDKVPFVLRLTYQYKRVERSTGFYINPKNKFPLKILCASVVGY